MATATLSAVPISISAAESTTGWGGNSFALNSGENIEGTNCLECAQTTNGNNDIYFDKASGSWDLTSEKLRLWFLTNIVGNLSATNPIQVFLFDGSNTAYYQWSKGDSYQGGWSQIIIDTANTPLSGSVTLSAVTRIGIRFVTSSKPRNVPYNTLVDAWTYGDGYTVTGGTTGDRLSWSDIASADATSQYRVVEEVNGVFFLRGDIQIGDGVSATWFEPAGQVAVFVDEQVGAQFGSLSFFDDASLLTNVNLAGGVISAGTQRPTFDASVTLNAFDLDGVQMSKLGTVDFEDACTVLNLSAADCYQIDPQSSDFQNFTISNYSEAAVNGALLWPGGTSVKNGAFIGCDEAIEITQTTDQTFDNMKFSSNTDDVHLNNGGTSITVNNSNGSDAASQVSTGGGTVTFSSSSNFTISAPTGGSLTIFDNEVVNGNNLDTILQGPTTTTGADVVYSHGYTSNDVVVQFYKDGFEEINVDFALTNAAQSLDLNPLLIPEENI